MAARRRSGKGSQKDVPKKLSHWWKNVPTKLSHWWPQGKGRGEGCANEAYTPRVQGWQEDCCCSNMLDTKTRRTGSSNSLLDTKARKTGRHNSLLTFAPTPKDSLETNRMNPCRRLQCSAKKKKGKQVKGKWRIKAKNMFLGCAEESGRWLHTSFWDLSSLGDHQVHFYK